MSEATKAREFTYDEVRERLLDGRGGRFDSEYDDEDYDINDYVPEEPTDPQHQEMMNLIERWNQVEQSTVIDWDTIV